MKISTLAGAVAATTFMFTIGAVAPASAADSPAFGIEQTVSDPNGGELGYTVTKLFPSEDAVPYPVSGQLYEASVRAHVLNGIVAPVVQSFSVRSESGQSYPALAGAWTPYGLTGAPLFFPGSTSGKLYFDVTGDPPNSVVYNAAGETLGWAEPVVAPPAEEAASDEGDSGGESAAAPESESSDTGAAADSAANADVATSEEEG